MLSDARKSFQEHLGYVWSTLVEDEEWILQRVGSVTLENTGIILKEGSTGFQPVRLKDAVEAFLRFTDKPMVATREAVTTGLALACADGLVGIGRGGSPSTLLSRYCRQSVSLDPSEDGVWVIPPFVPEPEKAEPKPADTSAAGGERTPAEGPGVVTVEGPGTAGEPQAGGPATERSVRRFVVRSAVPVESWGELFRCFVGPAARMNLKMLQLGVQFEMEVGGDQQLTPNDPTLKAMKEAARQLGLTLEVEE